MLVPERLPILETHRAVEALARSGIPVGAILVDRVLPTEAGHGFLARRREREQEHFAEIGATCASYPIFRIPMLETEVSGLCAPRQIGVMLPSSERGAIEVISES